jgi:uncharacterized protein (TIGR00369 family)
MGTAMASTLEDNESFTTLDLTVKFFKPIWNARIEAVARVTRRTRTRGFIEREVSDESGSLVAKPSRAAWRYAASKRPGADHVAPIRLMPRRKR